MTTTNSAHLFSIAFRSTLLGVFTLLFGTSVFAITNPVHIERAVHSHIQRALDAQPVSGNTNQRIEFKVGKVDPHLRLANCSKPLTVTRTNNKLLGRVTTKVQCTGATPWAIYVPVHVKVYKQVVVAAAPLTRNLQLDSSHLHLAEMEVSRLSSGYFTDIAHIEGKELNRPVMLSGVIKPSMINEPMLIEKGDEVIIMATTGSLAVKSDGVATMNGRAGQQINVKNKKSNRIIKARVINKGLVQVVM